MIAMVIESYLEGHLQLDDVATQPNNTSLILKASFHFRRRMRKLINNYSTTFNWGKEKRRGGGGISYLGKKLTVTYMSTYDPQKVILEWLRLFCVPEKTRTLS